MNLNSAWQNFVKSGKIEDYLAYLSIKNNLGETNAVNNQSPCNKNNGYK